MSIHKYDILTLLTSVVGFSSLAADAAFSSQLSTVFGTNAKVGLAVLGLLGAFSAQLIRVLSNPTVDSTPVVVPTTTGSTAVVDAPDAENKV